MAGTPGSRSGGDISQSFNWLSRGSRGTAYISYAHFSHLPASSFDFGNNGYAGCCNYGGELLHFSSPSDRHGLVFARGKFSTSLYSVLARSQRKVGGPSTFGLELTQHTYQPEGNSGDPKEESMFRLGNMLDRGCFNYRWPFNEYSLLGKQLATRKELYQRMERQENQSSNQGKENILSGEKEHIADEDSETGTYAVFSFIKDGILYQVLRIEQGCWSDSISNICYSFPEESLISLTIGGPLLFQPFDTPMTSDECAKTGESRDESSKSERGQRVPKMRLVPAQLAPGMTQPPPDTCVQYLDPVSGIGLEAVVYRILGEQPVPLPLVVSDSVEDNGCESSDSKDGGGKLAACRALHRLSFKNGLFEKQSATFIAAFRLFEGSHWVTASWPNVPSSQDIYEYVGASPPKVSDDTSKIMFKTGSMWETIFLEQYLRPDFPGRLPEVSLIGRCFEKIMQVDMVPIWSFETDEPILPFALISNIFMHPEVNFKSLFWKIRFLTKVYHFLSKIAEPFTATNSAVNENLQSNRTDRNEQGNEIYERGSRVDDGGGMPPLDFDAEDILIMRYIAQEQLGRIKGRIKGIVYFLVQVLDPDGSLNRTIGLFKTQSSADETDSYYIMITLWYVVRNLPDFDWPRARMRNISKANTKMPPLPADDNKNFGEMNKDKIPLLQWYHHGSILQLCGKGFLSKSWEENGLRAKKVHRLRNAAWITSAIKISRSPYCANDEIFDRLSFLGHELGLEELEGSASTIAKLSMKRIKERDFTRYLNPGWLSPQEEGYIEGPWEVHALCHHSRLMTLSLEYHYSEDRKTLEQKAEEVELYKKKCHFINSEATLVPCWERSHLKARQGWIHSEASSVLASTLLDLHEKCLYDPSCCVKSTSPLTDQTKVLSSPWLPGGQSNVGQEMKYIGDFMSKQIKALGGFAAEGNLPTPIEWVKTWKPPQRYHPDAFIHSLDDTPALYQAWNLKKSVRVPVPLHKYMTLPEDLEKEKPEGFIKKDLEVLKELKSIYVVDIVEDGIGKESPGLLGRLVASAATDDEDELVRRLYDSMSAIDCYQNPDGHNRSDSGAFQNGKRISLPSDFKRVVETSGPEEKARDHRTLLSCCFELRVSSLMLSTNDFGDFSQCFIISELIGYPELKKLGEEGQKLWQRFIHQPQTGRCLVFFLVLGKLCQEIARQYRGAVDVISSTLNLDGLFSSKNKGQEDDREVHKFQLGLWSLESLYKLQYSLRESLESVTSAKEQLMVQIKYGPGTRSEPLERMCQESIDIFESCLLELTSVAADLERDIELNSRYKDAFEAVLALTDSRTSLSQNDISLNQNRTIQRLTYLTIGYLPLGLIAAIFAIPGEQRVVHESMGLKWFIGSILVLLAFTSVMAVLIGRIGSILEAVGCSISSAV
ncbi:uncharacterized protein BDR25DRAFT_368108 [Lindgomyces ingoldianus]|uniref:Uncharacterized protein n=1 Tax=Lindgomyces ingoldianus TaxID=673940 RepID=A0ACB6QZ13_9PLEO|nr:uncharacterized protein BDR25DRAFT_368108 [Lindgomyces ingoldianus]KAF2471305.1 hypothetical protein BDR25DRAFT_368108 [Lindgomyces ingoldianus]